MEHWNGVTELDETHGLLRRRAAQAVHVQQRAHDGV